jgi:hypothetical protein
MNWLARLKAGCVVLLATGCALDSKPIGGVDEGSSTADDDGEAGSGEDDESGDPSATGGDPQLCPGNPHFSCTVPFDCVDQPCTEDPFDNLDENGCPQVACSEAADCGDGDVCVFIPGAGSSIECMDDETSEVPRCMCGGTADANGRNQCVPLAAVDPERYCEGIEPGQECDDAPAIPYDDTHDWNCRTVPIMHLTYDESTDQCNGEEQEICLAGTYNRFGGDDGCGGSECTWGGGPTELFGGSVRQIGENEWQLLSLRTYYCGSEANPLGEWTECQDTALGACACTCP